MIGNRPTKRWGLLQAAVIGGGISLAGLALSLNNEGYTRWMWMLEYGNPAETAGRIAAIFAFPLVFVAGAFIRNCWHNVRDDGYGRWHTVLRFALFFVLCTAWCLGVVFVVSHSFPYIAVSLSLPYESVFSHFLSWAAQVLGFFLGGWLLAWLMGLLRTPRQPSPVQLSSD
jgi:hypothetical protein